MAERKYGGKTMAQLRAAVDEATTGNYSAEKIDKVSRIAAWSLPDLLDEITRLRAERPSSEELASLKAERNALHRELSNIIPRFEKALAVTGSDPEFIVEATRRHRAALHPAGSGREEG